MSADVAPRAVLLDTCAMIWLASGAPLQGDAEAMITHAGLADGVFASPISAWEIGMLSRLRAAAPVFLPSAAAWFARFMAGPAMKSAPFTAEIAIAASYLPEPLHSDPADRLLIATARDMGVPIVTRDAKIIAYAEAGHVSAIPC